MIHEVVRFLKLFFAMLLASLTLACTQADHESQASQTLILLGGDVHFGENYISNNLSPGSPGPRNDQERYVRTLARLKPFIDRSAFTIVNLETPLSFPVEDSPVKGIKRYIHWSDGKKAARAIASAGIDAVNLANNHMLDQGQVGLKDTLAILSANNIPRFGADLQLSGAQKPLLQKVARPSGKKVTLAIFGMFDKSDTTPDNVNLFATAVQGGVAPIDVENFRLQVQTLRADNPDLYVIAYPHWGRNYAWVYKNQRKYGRALIEAGADIVIGQHAHTVQEIERYHGKWILYGIGNFAFVAGGRYATFDKILPYGLAVQLEFGENQPNGPTIRLFPILTDNLKSGFQTRPVDAREARRVLSVIQSRTGSIGFYGDVVTSDPLGAAIKLRATKKLPWE